MKLVGADTFLACGHEMKSQKPFIQLDMGILKKRSHSYRKMLAATVALVKTWAMAFASKSGDFFRTAAMRANRAIRPAQFFKVLSGGFFIGKNWVHKDCVHGSQLL